MRWEINQKVDIKRGAQGVQLWPNALMILGDNEAHIWKIKILDNGEDIVVSGTVTGYFVRPDGNTIMVAGTLEGNIASVILPQAVYAQKGNVQGIVRLSYGDGQIVTLSALILPIRQVLTDSIIDPGEVIPSIDDLLAQIDAMEAATARANAAGLNFRGNYTHDADPLYAKHDLVYFNGGSFVYTNDTPSNEPTSSTSHWQQIASMGGQDLVDAAVAARDAAQAQATLAQGYAAQLAAGTASPAGTYANLAALISADPDHSKIYITLDDGQWCYHNGSAFVAGGVYQATERPLDTTLSVSGMAADAKVTGDKVGELKSALNDAFDEESYNIIRFPEWEKGHINNSGADVAGNNNARTHNYFDVTAGTTYNISWTGTGYAVYIWFYNSSYTYLSNFAAYASNKTVTAPANAKYIRISTYVPSVTSLDLLVPDKMQFSAGSSQLEYLSGNCLDKSFAAKESIPADRLVPGSINNANLADSSVYGSKIQNGAITNEKIADESVSLKKTSFYQVDGNLYNGSFSFGIVSQDGSVVVVAKSNAVSSLIDLFVDNPVYTLVSTLGSGVTKYIHWYAENMAYLGYFADYNQTTPLKLIAPEGARYMRILTYKEGETVLANITPTGIILNVGGLPLPDTNQTLVLIKTGYHTNFANQAPADATIRGIAHKGLSADAPENTAAAFVAARRKGFRYIETDVRKSSDGHYVLIHDTTVNRTTNGTGNVADKTLAQLQALDAGSWFGSRFAGEKILSLEEACELFRKLDLIPYLELKYKPSTVSEATAMNEIVKKSGIKYIWLGDVPDYVLFKEADPDVSFCFLASVVPSSESFDYYKAEKASGMDVRFTLMSNAMTKEFAEECALYKIPLDTYTLNTVSEIIDIVEYPVTGVLSDGFHVDDIIQKYGLSN